MVSVSVLGFEKIASKVSKNGTCHEICEKNVTIKTKKRRLAKLEPQKWKQKNMYDRVRTLLKT